MFSEHFFHTFLILVTLCWYLLFWFQRNKRKKSSQDNMSARVSFWRGVFLILIFFSFLLFHIAPGQLVISHYHHEQFPTGQHLCCMPQNTTIVNAIYVDFSTVAISYLVQRPLYALPFLFAESIRNKSPPRLL